MTYFKIFFQIRYQRKLDTSDEFYKKIGIHGGNFKKRMGLYEAENTKNQNICTIPINPKEYF